MPVSQSCSGRASVSASFSRLRWMIDLERRTLRVSKSYQNIDGEDVITPPKTPKGNRVVPLPEAMCDVIRVYVEALYEYEPDERLFPFTKSYFHKEMAKACAASGMPKIRLHDLRHSHASLLIEMGVPVLLISERLGHEDVETTLRTYGHLYPARNDDTMQRLNALMVPKPPAGEGGPGDA